MIIGYIFAVIIPLVGFVLGLVALSNDDPNNKKHGPWIVVASVVAFIFWFVIIVSVSASSGPSTY